MKKINLFILILIHCSAIFAQNITSTLGTSGTFSLKYSATTFLSLSQADSILNLNYKLMLPYTTSSSIGVICKGADRFLHNYGTENTFLGVNSGNFTMTGTGGNTALGYYSLYFNTSGYKNTALGNYSLYSNTTGGNNTSVGYFSLRLNTSGASNTALGSYSLYLNTTGAVNTAVGDGSLFSNSTGSRNTAVGTGSLSYNSTGYNNTSVGVYSLSSNMSGYENTAIGYRSLYMNSIGSINTALGSYSLYSNVGSDNTALGFYSLYSNTVGYENTASGSYSLRSNTTGNDNNAFGRSSLFSNTTGYYNSAFGVGSLFSNTTGYFNTALGCSSGGDVTTGYNLTLIGYNAEPTSGSATNQITLGNSSITSLRCAVTTITAISDARDKKNISDLSLGLDFLMQIKPRLFNWDKREWYEDNFSDGSKMQETPTAGFIAQELDEVQIKENAEWLNLVLKDNPDKLEATPGNLLPIIVKAIQELSEGLLREKTEKDNEIAELKTENDLLKSQVEELKSANDKLNKLEAMYILLNEKIEKINSTKEVKLTGNK